MQVTAFRLHPIIVPAPTNPCARRQAAARQPEPADDETTQSRSARTRHARESHRRQGAQRDQHLGDHRRAGDRGRRQIVAVLGEEPDHRIERWRGTLREIFVAPPLPAKAANTSRVATGTPGLTSTAGRRRHGERLRQELADAAHHRGRGVEAYRHVGADGERRRLPTVVVARDAVGARQQPQRGRCVSRAAAEPGRHRNLLVEQETPGRERGHLLGATPPAALSTRLSPARPQARCERAGNIKRGGGAGGKLSVSAMPAKADQAFKHVIAVPRRPSTRKVRLILAGAVRQQRDHARACDSPTCASRRCGPGSKTVRKSTRSGRRRTYSYREPPRKGLSRRCRPFPSCRLWPATRFPRAGHSSACPRSSPVRPARA